MHVMGSVSPATGGDGFPFHKEDAAVVEATSPPRPSRISHHGENGTRPPNPSPPLPPPPPPPPPPPVPLEPNQRVEDLKKKRVRSFFWRTIPEEQVKGRANVWTQGPVQQNFDIDVQEIEELFGQKERQSNATAPPTRGVTTRAPFRATKEEVFILDPKRGLTVGIFLKQFRRSNQAIVDDVRHGNSESLGAGPLRELLKLLPEKDEAKKLKAYRGDAAKLPLADSFVHLLIQVPSYSVLIESMLLKEEFPGSCEAVRRDLDVLRSATRELMCCTELHAVLHLVLQAGNILNAGGSAGNAAGFKLSSLLSLADTKSNRPGMNLLHFVALEAQKKDEKLLEFPVRLSGVQTASRISLETLDAELQALTSRTRSVEESVQKDTQLLQQLDGFLQSATASLCSLRGSQQQLKKEGDELMDFFCEDRETFRLDDCFGVFHTFCVRFSTAVKENMEREAKEAARLQQMKDKELKRRSWAGGEEVRGAVGLRCSSETDMSTVVSEDDTGLLMALLTPKSPRRSSPKSDRVTRGRSLHSQRTRNPPSSTPLFAAERELSTYFKLSKDRKVPQQRGKGDSRTSLPSASPKSEPTGTGTSTKADPQTIPLPSKTSSDSTFISKDDVQTQGKEVKCTSCSNQRSDLNNNDNSQVGVSLSSQENLQTHSCSSRKTDENVEQGAAPKGNVSVLSEKCPLVPELKAFEEDEHHRQQDRTIIKDVHEEVADKSQIPNLQNNSKDGEKSNVGVPAARSPSQRQDSEEQEDKVMVWCVTGVCESTSEHVQMEKDQLGSKSHGENQRASSPPPKHMSSEPSPDSDKSASIPISSQPVSRCNDSSLLASSPGLHPAEPAPASPGPGLTVEEDNVSVSQGEGPKKTRNEKANVAPVSEQTTDFKTKTSSRRLTEKASSTDGKAKLATSSRQSTKSFHTSKPQNTLMKPSTPNTSTSVRSVRTLTSSENMSMRRVVPITNTSRGASAVAKHPEKPTAHSQSSFRTTVSTSQLNASNRQGERPSTAPSRRSSNKMPESKELRNQKVSGVQAATRTQNSDVQKKPSIRKAFTKPKTQTDEKMCLIKLRALAQGEGGGSVSAPVTPLHKNKTSSSSVLPGFALNTASSSFRRTKTSLATSLSHAGSPKIPFKISSLSPLNASSAVSHTGSLTTSRSASPLRTSENIRSSTRSSLTNSLVLSKDHRDNGSISDKSTHVRESSKTTRPNWR
ncbi:FH2 domain-containing protein 1-like [Nematolebias whitei]|uniref:FH2 domain-containing protein 1-like n=1 Tax=Nematolebias whitei TaxID=451745 RepID=UPI001897CD18|nr:FH2 domain-containing protein 1-like [Nematolebias whitei]